MGMAMLRDCYQTVVSFLLSVLVLLTFNHTDEARLNHAAGERRRVHKQQNIGWISIVGLRGRNKPEIVWELHPIRKHAIESERAQIRVKFVFIPATLWRLNHHMDG